MTHLAKDRGDPYWLHMAVMVPVSPPFGIVAIHPYWSSAASGCRLAIRALVVKSNGWPACRVVRYRRSMWHIPTARKGHYGHSTEIVVLDAFVLPLPVACT